MAKIFNDGAFTPAWLEHLKQKRGRYKIQSGPAECPECGKPLEDEDHAPEHFQGFICRRCEP